MKFTSWVGSWVLALPLITLFTLIGALWASYWLYPTWDWFVIPLGVRPISFWHFVALLLVVRTVLIRSDIKKDERRVDWCAVMIGFLSYPLAWVLLRWMR